MKKRIARAAIQSFFISVFLVFIEWLAKSYYGEWGWLAAALDFAIGFVVLGIGFFLESLWRRKHSARPKAKADTPFRAAEAQQTEPLTIPELLKRDALRSLGFGVLVTIFCSRFGLIRFNHPPLLQYLISYGIYTLVLFCALFLSDWLCSLLEKARPKHST